MKVFELINELKGTDATLEQIKEWSYMNRIPPCGLEEGLELDCKLPKVLHELRSEVCSETGKCYPDCLNKFFDMEIPEDKA